MTDIAGIRDAEAGELGRKQRCPDFTPRSHVSELAISGASPNRGDEPQQNQLPQDTHLHAFTVSASGARLHTYTVLGFFVL